MSNKRKASPRQIIDRRYKRAMSDLCGYELRHGVCPGQREVIRRRYEMELTQLAADILSK